MPRIIKAILCAVLILAPLTACWGTSPNQESNYYVVETRETLIVNGVPFTTHVSSVVSGAMLQRLAGAVGLVENWTARTNFNGRYTVNNPVVPAMWRFLMGSGACSGQYAQFPDPTDPTGERKITATEVRRASLVILSCAPPEKVNTVFQSVDGEGNVIARTCCNTDVLYANQALHQFESLTSANGLYYLVYRGDGELAIYNSSLQQRTWSSNVWTPTVGQAIMQGDGNFVVYDGYGSPVWYTGTYGNPSAYVVMRNDGNLVVYSSNGYPLWASGGGAPRQVSLQTVSTGHYVVAEGGGGGVVNANRTAIGAWETFTLIDANGGDLMNGDEVNFQTSGSWYLQAEGCGGGAMLAVAPSADSWETFRIRLQSGPDSRVDNGEEIAIESVCGYFAVAEGGGGGVVNVNRTSIGGWEKFRLIIH